MKEAVVRRRPRINLPLSDIFPGRARPLQVVSNDFSGLLWQEMREGLKGIYKLVSVNTSVTRFLRG